MPSSTLTAKQLDVRARDYATSTSTVSIKAYDSSSTYEFYLPNTNPKFLDGISGQEQVADQILTYDIATDKYVWKQGGSELFIQGTTTTIGSDERGNVLTVGSEARVIPGDPLYDPSKPQDEQVFKVEQVFTDTLYNMSQFAAGKTAGVVTYDKTTGLYLGFSEAAANPGGSNDAQKQAKDMLTLTTKKKSNGSEYASVVLKPKSAAVTYTSTADKATSLDLSDNLAVLKAQGKDLQNMQLEKQVSKCYPGLTSTTATSLSQKPAEFEYSFGADSSKFKVDNATKILETDMSTIEFGESSAKHRFKIFDGKLYIQKYDSTQSKWVGADAIIDQTATFTATITIDSVTVTDDDIVVAATLGGTGADHWHVMVDDDSAGVQMPASGATQAFTSLYAGVHKVVAWPVDDAHAQVGERVFTNFTIVTSTTTPDASVSTATVDLATVVTGTSVSVSATIGGTGGDHWNVLVDDASSTLQTPAAGVSATFSSLSEGLHTVTGWPVDASDVQVGPKVVKEIEVVSGWTASVAVSSSVAGADATISATLSGSGATYWSAEVDGTASTRQTVASGANITFAGLASGAHAVTAWPVVDGAGVRVGPNASVSVTIA
jgi:hypothetical protein